MGTTLGDTGNYHEQVHCPVLPDVVSGDLLAHGGVSGGSRVVPHNHQHGCHHTLQHLCHHLSGCWSSYMRLLWIPLSLLVLRHSYISIPWLMEEGDYGSSQLNRHNYSNYFGLSI